MNPTSTTSLTFEALEDLYDRYAEPIYRYALGMLGRSEDAEDAVQAIWLKLARTKLGTVSDPQAYLWTAARHHVYTVIRRRALSWKRTAEPEEAEMLPIAENPDLSPERRRDVERAILQLPVRLREVVLLVGFEGFTLQEASVRLDIPAGTAASRYRRAVEKLRARLQTKESS